MSSLIGVWTDNPKVCCPAMFQRTSTSVECLTPVHDFMSCESLLQTDGYRTLMFLFAVLALFGNAFSFVLRVFVERATATHGFAVFVTHLCVADFLMGVYLAIIGVADRIYGDDYFWQDLTWTKSAACSTAGFLCLLSSEVSAFIIALITLDRYLVFRFPFRQVRFSVTSATVAVIIVWIVGVVIAFVPLLPVTSHWVIYSRTATCFSLPFQADSPGYDYTFGIVIVVNFVIFLLVATGQAFIYTTIRDNDTPLLHSKSRDTHVARRLVAIAMSDFLCWFPVGLLGVLAAAGTPIPRSLGLLVATAVLPLNSAMNPFWYTLNSAREKLRLRHERNILHALNNQSLTL